MGQFATALCCPDRAPLALRQATHGPPTAPALCESRRQGRLRVAALPAAVRLLAAESVRNRLLSRRGRTLCLPKTPSALLKVGSGHPESRLVRAPPRASLTIAAG